MPTYLRTRRSPSDPQNCIRLQRTTPPACRAAACNQPMLRLDATHGLPTRKTSSNDRPPAQHPDPAAETQTQQTGRTPSNAMTCRLSLSSGPGLSPRSPCVPVYVDAMPTATYLRTLRSLNARQTASGFKELPLPACRAPACGQPMLRLDATHSLPTRRTPSTDRPPAPSSCVQKQRRNKRVANRHSE